MASEAAQQKHPAMDIPGWPDRLASRLQTAYDVGRVDALREAADDLRAEADRIEKGAGDEPR